MIYVVYFANAGTPATGLTPAFSIYSKVSDGTDVTPHPEISEITTGGVGGGFYKFTATPAEAIVARIDGGASLPNADRYKVMQITANDGALDAAITSRSTLTAQQVWEYATRTLSSFGTLAADVWSSVTRTLTAGTRDSQIDAIKAKTDNLPAAPAVEGNVQGHVADALAAYDPPTRAEATTDKDTVLAAIAALNDITVGELLAGDLSDSLSFPANSLADRLRKLFWILCNRLVITDASGAFTAYKTDGVTPAATGTITDNGTNTVRSAPTWP
jgi:hypothetical protein